MDKPAGAQTKYCVTKMRNTGQRKSMNQTGLRDANMNVIEGNKSLNFYYLPSSDREKRLKINKAKKETLTKRPQTKVKHHQGSTSVTSKHG